MLFIINQRTTFQMIEDSEIIEVKQGTKAGKLINQDFNRIFYSKHKYLIFNKNHGNISCYQPTIFTICFFQKKQFLISIYP